MIRVEGKLEKQRPRVLTSLQPSNSAVFVDRAESEVNGASISIFSSPKLNFSSTQHNKKSQILNLFRFQEIPTTRSSTSRTSRNRNRTLPKVHSIHSENIHKTQGEKFTAFGLLMCPGAERRVGGDVGGGPAVTTYAACGLFIKDVHRANVKPKFHEQGPSSGAVNCVIPLTDVNSTTTGTGL